MVVDHPTVGQCVEAMAAGRETERWCARRKAWISSNDEAWVTDRPWDSWPEDKVMSHQRIVIGGGGS